MSGERLLPPEPKLRDQYRRFATSSAQIRRRKELHQHRRVRTVGLAYQVAGRRGRGCGFNKRRGHDCGSKTKVCFVFGKRLPPTYVADEGTYQTPFLVLVLRGELRVPA